MTERVLFFFPKWFLGLFFMLAAVSIFAGYKPRPWSVRPRDSYPASLTSEGVTIAVEPLFKDVLAAQVFDKKDILTRGIMPLSVVIFNDNGFPIEVDGLSIELIHEDDRIRTLSPNEVVYRLFKKGDKNVWLPQPIPRVSGGELNRDALEDFDHKFLLSKTVGPHDKGGGFIYLHLPDSKNVAAYLSKAAVYIPNVYRQDNGSKLIFFEIELKPAIDAIPPD